MSQREQFDLFDEVDDSNGASQKSSQNSSEPASSHENAGRKSVAKKIAVDSFEERPKEAAVAQDASSIAQESTLEVKAEASALPAINSASGASKAKLNQQESRACYLEVVACLQNINVNTNIDADKASRDLLGKAFKRYLQTLVTRRYLTHIDLYFAEFMAHQKHIQNPHIWLGYWILLLLVSRAYGFGHTALPFTYLHAPSKWFSEVEDPYRSEVIWQLISLMDPSSDIIFNSSSPDFGNNREVDKCGLNPQAINLQALNLQTINLENLFSSMMSFVTMPLVLTDEGIYLDRNYQQENEIVEFFSTVAESDFTTEEIRYLAKRLSFYFGEDNAEMDWQKFAAANSLLNQISVISGGPGTGKTTTVFKILQTLVDLHQYRAGNEIPFKILLTAPTGKAAARLSESILKQIQKVQAKLGELPEAIEMAARAQLEMIPHAGQTLHRLLLINPFTRKPKYNRFNPLDFDVLIVDEASMIDQQMLVQLINALPKEGRVIFLGDKDQLASVEAGAIMHELCAKENYSEAHITHLSQLLGISLSGKAFSNVTMPAFNYLSFLKKSYRFRSDSALGALAKLVNNSEEQGRAMQYEAVMQLFKDANHHAENALGESLQLTMLPMPEKSLETIIRQEFSEYLDILPNNAGIEFAEEAFKVFQKVGVLSARRTGLEGAIELNHQIRRTLFPSEAGREFFHGLPIMITHNSAENNLFNGDVGLILRNETGDLRAYFEGVESARVFSIHTLPKFEPAFAMTIHKSQGSEFKRVLLFLGAEPSAFLTKELFYTGITRAKKSVHLFASDAALKAALAGRVDRYSFIHQRLCSALAVE